MLTLALVTHNDGAALDAALNALAGLATPTRPLLLMDQGSQDGSRAYLHKFAHRHGGTLVPLDAPLSLPEAAALARQNTGADYALALRCSDRINRTGLVSLEQTLNALRPGLAVLAGGWWMTGPGHPLPAPDAVRASALPSRPDADDLATLYPDPRRLLIRHGQCDVPDPASHPRAAREVWNKVTGTIKQTLFHADPVLLQPPPEYGAAATLDAIAALLHDTVKPERAACLAGLMAWAGDALSLAPPDAADATLAAATRLLATLPRSLRRQACAAPAPTGPFLSAVHNGQDGVALARLSLLASARSDMAMRAMTTEYAALRRDLEAALPGPDYLRDLHARLRGM